MFIVADLVSLIILNFKGMKVMSYFLKFRIFDFHDEQKGDYE